MMLFLLGFGLAFTHILGPLHELGHIAAGGGYIVDWTHSKMQYHNLGSYIAGYQMEFGVPWVLSLVFRQRWGAVFLGYASGVVLSALSSTDFEKIADMGYRLNAVRLGWVAVTLPLCLLAWVLRDATRRRRPDSKPSASP